MKLYTFHQFINESKEYSLSDYKWAIGEVDHIVGQLAHDYMHSSGLGHNDTSIVQIKNSIIDNIKRGDSATIESLKELAWSQASQLAVEIIKSYSHSGDESTKILNQYGDPQVMYRIGGLRFSKFAEDTDGVGFYLMVENPLVVEAVSPMDTISASHIKEASFDPAVDGIVLSLNGDILEVEVFNIAQVKQIEE